MTLWKTPATLAQLEEISKNTMMEQLGIEYLEIGDDSVKAKMPVNHRTKQPDGILHGGPRLFWPKPWAASRRGCAWTGKRKIQSGSK